MVRSHVPVEQHTAQHMALLHYSILPLLYKGGQWSEISSDKKNVPYLTEVKLNESKIGLVSKIGYWRDSVALLM